MTVASPPTHHNATQNGTCRHNESSTNRRSLVGIDEKVCGFESAINGAINRIVTAHTLQRRNRFPRRRRKLQHVATRSHWTEHKRSIWIRDCSADVLPSAALEDHSGTHDPVFGGVVQSVPVCVIPNQTSNSCTQAVVLSFALALLFFLPRLTAHSSNFALHHNALT